ncbi:hypothetical protein BDN72DRAFT_907083 [Pluteus cervinus]|uniref:Uncharacterized protein n=1 Tax=Pluteus cervinus TaxID=181527 RepID=A0ACD2ZXD9_9AGAR|nr:hypothetical protein BDN72DRAFT_907083 [Pluteus cervinus]
MPPVRASITFTLHDTSLDWDTVHNILLWVPDWRDTVPTPTIITPDLWTGSQILRLMTPQYTSITQIASFKSSFRRWHRPRPSSTVRFGAHLLPQETGVQIQKATSNSDHPLPLQVRTPTDVTDLRLCKTVTVERFMQLTVPILR